VVRAAPSTGLRLRQIAVSLGLPLLNRVWSPAVTLFKAQRPRPGEAKLKVSVAPLGIDLTAFSVTV
jgi:hypothetical protein